MVVTCPVRSIQRKVAEKDYTVSLGKVLSLRPFFVTYPTEKELSLCICKLCLNSKLLFEPILVQAKKFDDDISKSLTEFYMSSCSWPKAVNGFKCVTLKCKECKDAKPQSLSCQEDNTLLKIGKFEVTAEYANKKKETKKSNKTERVEHQLSFRDILQKLNKIKKEYIKNKFQIYNDKAYRPTILETPNTYEGTYHMDFSESLTQLFEYESQSSHFNESQYSLHCTVKHRGFEESPYHYLYHLSNVMQHDHTFTSAVVNEIIKSNGIPEIIHFKLDNCSTQYNCKWIFRFWNNLAKKLITKVIIYYGIQAMIKAWWML